MMSRMASGSLTRPSQTGRPLALRPSAEGWTTITLACSQASRQSVGRTVATPARDSRRLEELRAIATRAWLAPKSAVTANATA
ncbi:hypothetical protein BG452_17470 [Streptomyces sp. CBMA123]|nr:hypothetical protein [Streptomyces sp. CBMA123]